MHLGTPALKYLEKYRAAVETRWWPSTTQPEAAAEVLITISSDPDGFINSLYDPDALGDDIQLPEGSFVKRLPSFCRLIRDDDFRGSIKLIRRHGTDALPWRQ